MSVPLYPVIGKQDVKIPAIPHQTPYSNQFYDPDFLAANSPHMSEFYPRSTNMSNTSIPAATIQEETFCKWILYRDIVPESRSKSLAIRDCILALFANAHFSRVRIWDLIILIPNLIFFLFLLIRFNRTRLKLRATSSPIFLTFYGLILTNAVISLIRCGVAMCVNATVSAGDIADKILWVAVRFFMFSTEMSVVIFGLAFGHLDSKTSIRRVLAVTSFISLAYSITQGALEILTPEESFRVIYSHYDVFAHGGMLFWFVSSCVFFVIYALIFISPWTALRDRLALPSKQSFYYYALFLSILNAVQAIGAGMLYYQQSQGFCLIDTTTYIYYTTFTPLVYRTFLSDFFSVAQPSIMFSYKPQVDDDLQDQEDVGLPHQLSCSSLKTDSDYIYQNTSVYESTHFDSSSVNPLYIHSLQSPDSVVTFDGTVSMASSVESPPAMAPIGSLSINNSDSITDSRKSN
ncbi:Transmembrane protein adipocyte-associated 1 [Nymphon striatum]|nr:Transmembrane protein adipocyte-associated 1 [Nymphon striatum]